MIVDIIKFNYDYIIEKLLKEYPGLGVPMKHLEFSPGIKSCFEILKKWPKNSIIWILFYFNETLPDDADVNMIIKNTVNKFIVILSWDTLVDKLYSMKFKYGPTDTVILSNATLHPRYLDLILTFKSIQSAVDVVIVTFSQFKFAADVKNSWKNVAVQIDIENRLKARAHSATITISSFNFHMLASFIDNVY